MNGILPEPNTDPQDASNPPPEAQDIVLECYNIRLECKHIRNQALTARAGAVAHCEDAEQVAAEIRGLHSEVESMREEYGEEVDGLVRRIEMIEKMFRVLYTVLGAAIKD